MSTYKYLYYRPDLKQSDRFVNIHLLVGYTANNLEAFNQMADVIQEAFPFVGRQEIQFGQVTRSTYCLNFTIATVGVSLPEGFVIPSDWRQHDNGRFPYNFSH